RGQITSGMAGGTGTGSVHASWGGHFEGQSPGGSVNLISGVDCHNDLTEDDYYVAVRHDALSPIYTIVSGCSQGSGGPITVACGLEVNDDTGFVQIDPSIACDGLYWDSENC